MSEWVLKLVKNALNDLKITDWSDLECNICKSVGATHALVSINDAMNNPDMVILLAECDQCFEDDVLDGRWIHKDG